MLKILLLCALVALTEAQGRILSIEGYPLEWLREPQPGTPAAADAFRPTPVPFRPLTNRVIYRHVRVPGKIDDSAAQIIVEGRGLNGLAAKLIAPGAQDCTAAAWTPNAAIGVPLTTNAQFTSAQTFRRFFTIPIDAELPHEHMMPWLCLCTGDVANMAATCADGMAGNWVHTNMRIAVTLPCDGDVIASAADTLQGTYLCNLRANSLLPSTTYSEVDEFGFATAASKLFLERKQRTRCCGWREASTGVSKRYGVCINPKLENCCSRSTGGVQGQMMAAGGTGKPYNVYREKCCYGGWVSSDAEIVSPTRASPEPTIISYLDDFCPCTIDRTNDYCNQVVPAPPVGVIKSDSCCTKNKYPELISGSEKTIWGKCYDGINTQCCDTGDLYDPGSRQCCKINGVQSLNVPCPCSIDSHCGTNSTCCQDKNRPLFPKAMESDSLCNKYVNYPSGTGPYEAQPCLGQCIDSRFQICCNGMACIDSYETCCNNTCCNKFNERCVMGLRPGARNFPANPKDFRIPYEVCTSLEALTPFRAIQVFFLPLCLLAATVVSLAAVLFFAKRQSTLQPMSTYEKAMFLLTCLLIFFGWPFFFSPLYKYGIAMVWTAFFVMLASMSQIRQYNIAAVVVTGLLILYLIDPFYGNDILTLASSRIAPPANGIHGFSGILSSVGEFFLFGQQACINWYDYFQRDPHVEDRIRWDNPEKNSYGFCARDWYAALAISGILGELVTFILFFVTLVTHLRNVLFEKAQKTDEIVGWY